jgi:hypothetical protein
MELLVPKAKSNESLASKCICSYFPDIILSQFFIPLHFFTTAARFTLCFWMFNVKIHQSRNCCAVVASVPLSIYFSICFQRRKTKKTTFYNEAPFGLSLRSLHHINAFQCLRIGYYSVLLSAHFGSIIASCNRRISSYSVQEFQAKSVALS